METVMHALLMSFFLATPVKGTILPCESPEVEDGHIPVLSCYFSRDVIKYQSTISVHYFTRSDRETVKVLSSIWHNGIAEFFVHPDFSVYGNVTDKVHLQILYDVSRHAGQYQCRMTLNDAPQFSHCNFTTTSIVPSDTPNGDFTTPFEKSNPKQKHEIITILGIVFAVLLLFIYITLLYCCRRSILLYWKSCERKQLSVTPPETEPFLPSDLTNENEENKVHSNFREYREIMNLQNILDLWKHCLQEWFPDLKKKAYFVPDAAKAKENTNNTEELLGGRDFLKENCQRESEYDQARGRLVESLRKLAEEGKMEEIMIVLTKYTMANNIATSRSDTTSSGRQLKRRFSNDVELPSHFFPVLTEVDVKQKQQSTFDYVLIIHKQHGIILIVVSITGETENDHHNDKHLLQQLTESVKRMKHLKQILKSEISDVKDLFIPVTSTLALPRLDQEHLKKLLNDTNIEQKPKEIRHLKVLDSKLFYKDLFTPSPVVSSAVRKWWTSLTGGNKEKHSLNGHLYKELIARFCGPISTVQVPKAILRRMCSMRDRKKTAPVNKTEASTKASAEVQKQYMQIVLSRQQIDCLSLETKCVFLTGPPGAGKTLLLLLKATKWILAGGTVVIICGPGNNPGHFVSHVLINQLTDRLRYLSRPDLVKHVHLKIVDAWTDPYTFLDMMKGEHNVDLSQLYFLIDEMWVVDLSAKMKPLMPEMNKNVETAKKELDTLMEQKVETSSVNSTLRKAIVSLKSLDGIHAVSKGIIDREVQEFLKKLKIDLEKLKIDLEKLKDLKRAPEDKKNVSETLCHSIENISFYIDAIQSWLASPILMEITKEVYKNEHVGGLWCTGLWPSKCPNNYKMRDLGACIRCPPHVQRLLEQTETLASHLKETQYSYNSKASLVKPPHPLDCNQPQLLSHANHRKEGPPTEISDCMECGQALAAMLHSTLEDGQWNTKVGFSDILIVGRALLPIPSDSIFIRTLIGKQIPVTVMVHGSGDLNDDKHDESVVVTNTFNGHGLERAIVVFVPVIRSCELTSDKDGDESHCEGLGKQEAREQTSVSPKGDTFANEPWMRRMGEYNQRGLWFVASRCISNLIIIHM